MNKIEKSLKEKIVKLLREELEYVEGSHKDDTYYSQWVMAVSIKEVSKDSYIARTVVKTSYSGDYVDGSDITINIIDGKAELDLSFAEEEPIFHGGEIDGSIRWIEDINNFCYMQPEDPFTKKSHKEALFQALDEYSFETIGGYLAFDDGNRIGNLENLIKGLLMDTLEVTARELQVAGEERGPGNYRLEVNGPGEDKGFTLDLSDENTKSEISSKILGEIALQK